MPQMVRVGFVGAGSMGQCAHLKNYANNTDCEVVALAEPRSALAKIVAERYRVPKIYVDAEAMLEAEELDAIVAIQNFDHHGTVVKSLYKHGLPILTEKPLASSVEVAEEMLQALAEGGSWHMVGYHKRNDPATVAAKAEIDRLKATGELGMLKYVRITMPEGDWIASGFRDLIRTNEPVPETPADPCPPGMDDVEFARYVTFANYYIHQVNLMRHLLGESYEIDYTDANGILLTVRSQSGVTGVIEMSPYRTTLDWHESALVAFEHGFVKLSLPAPLDNKSGAVEFYRDPAGGSPESIKPTMPRAYAMQRQAANFVSAVMGDCKPMCEATEAVEDLKIARDYVRLRG